jgi:hypothetical protein
MEQQNQKIRNGWNDPADEWDRKLDAALAKYTAVEPRAGLESRILANLRAKREEMPHHAWWQWSWAVAAAVFITGALFVWRSVGPSHPQIAKQPAAAQQESVKPTRQLASNQTADNRAGSKPGLAHKSGVISRRPSNPAVAEAYPKLDVFPSPQPLSDEELALAQYVRNFPSDAKSVAQAQEATEKEVLAKMQALANESTKSN